MTTYYCPMHPEVESDKPGICTKCGSMKLIPKPEHKVILKQSKFSQYKPLIVIVGLITLITLVLGINDAALGMFQSVRVMTDFMAGFFIVFAGFKLLDITGFAHGYSTYDLLAKRWFGYGYIYPFIELALGLLYLIGYKTTPVLAVTFIVMGFSGLGVLNSLLKKEEIHCACLGTIIKVPLTTVALVEDFSMAGMAFVMLWINLM